MKLITMRIPVQEDTKEYLRVITDKISRDKILKWSISRVENDIAIVEVVQFSN